MMSPIKNVLTPALGAFALVICSCAMQTPQARIEHNPALYEALSPKQQELVSQGKIARGMPKTGVFLAMGNPDRRGQGHKDGQPYERWDYATLRPVYYNTFYGSYGYGGGCGRHGYYGVGYVPTVDYVRERAASVWFRKDRVDAWERVGLYR